MSNYKIAKLSDQVYEIQNFITEDELDHVMQLAKTSNNSDWYGENVQYDFWADKILNRRLLKDNDLFSNIEERVATLFKGNLEVTGINLQRYMMGDALGEHTDDHDGHKINGEQIFYGVVIYYNDAYEGGELIYPDLGITHKPVSRSLVLHGGKILHGTMPVKSNSARYISTMFVKHKLDEVVRLNEEVFGEVNGI